MNKLKKTLALLAALAMTTTAFVGCGDDDEEDTSEDTAAVADEDEEEDEAEEADEEDTDEDADADEDSDEEEASSSDSNVPTPDGTLGDDGDQLSILCWTDTDLNAMFEVTSAENATYVQVGSSGTEASEQYIQYFSSGEDADLYICDADWVMSYVNDDDLSAPLSALGIDESYYSDAYSYTVAIGTDTNGVLKGASWQAAAGAYVYRADLAEEYLGVTSPDEMQAKVSDWDTFWDTAAEVYEASDGQTAMADTIAGVWRAYGAGNRTSAWLDSDNVFQVDSAITDCIDMIYDAYTAGYICNNIDQWSNDWYAIGFANGTLANATMGYFFPSWSLTSTGQLASAEGYVAADEDNGVEEHWEDVGDPQYSITTGPTGWFWGGSWICVAPCCDNATAAAQFVYDMTINADTMKEYAVNHSDFVNNKTAMAEIIDEGSNKNVLFVDSQDQFEVLADSAAVINLDGIAGESDGTVTDAFVDAVTAYCQGGLADADACLDSFLDKVAEALPNAIVE